MTVTARIALATLLGLSAVACGKREPKVTADTIYSGGVILTMSDSLPTVEVLAVKDGKILAVGPAVQVAKVEGKTTTRVDLGGKVLLPGFIDAHSHFNNALQAVSWANVALPPVGTVTDIPSLLAVLEAHAARLKPAKGEWIIATGYDPSGLAEGRDVTVDDLDPKFPDHPVMLIHVSNHGAVLNSAGLAAFKIDATTPTPEGGIIARKPGTQNPAGLVMETAFLPIFLDMPQPGLEEKLAAFGPAQEQYAQNGYTTVCEGATAYGEYILYRKAAEDSLLFLDVAFFPIMTDLKNYLEDPKFEFNVSRNRLKAVAVKCFVDGSPQAGTAYFTRPYLAEVLDGGTNWRGESTLPQAQYAALIQALVTRGIRTFTHAYGDAAIDMVIAALRAAGVTAAADRRDVVVHSQFVRPDQLDAFVELGVVPSFFTGHAFFWGDLHEQNLGQERAYFMGPMRTAAAKGLHVTNHTDYSVTPLDPMMMVWSAVTRESRSGAVIGPAERVDPLTALRAITLNAAFAYGEEARKGSLEVGKLADLVILDRNPLQVPAGELRSIRVMETVKEGKTVFRAS